MTMAFRINVCTPFSHCEKTKPAVQVFFLFCFVLPAPLCARLCAHAHVHVCVYLAAAVVEQLPGLIII